METKNTERYDWDTEFDQANRTMTHTFSERVTVVVHWDFNTISLFKDDKLINKFAFENDYTLKQYEKFLLNVARSTHELKGITL
ncbi:MAG: hypothetical protein ACRCZB_08340 [Bacteroidales bacterium]